MTSIDGKTLFGENHMRLDLDGCAVHEDQTTATGGDDRQLIEISVDDSQPWRATFDLRYSRLTADAVQAASAPSRSDWVRLTFGFKRFFFTSSGTL